jgi:serine/threonine-protein kinase
MKRSRKGRRNLALVAFLLVLVAAALLVIVLNWLVMPLIVRRGRETSVPDVVGMDRFEAEGALVRSGLHLGEVRSVSDPVVPADRVVSQHPAAGHRVKLGRSVLLEVSRGAGRIRVPHAEGLSIPRATALLSDAGLVVDGVESLRTPNLPAGQVVATRPLAGTDVTQGDHVVIQVSSRVGNFPMPNLVGVGVETAQGIIASQGLVLGELKRAPSDEPAGSVLIQYPEEGMTVRDGDTVHLIVATGTPKR